MPKISSWHKIHSNKQQKSFPWKDNFKYMRGPSEKIDLFFLSDNLLHFGIKAKRPKQRESFPKEWFSSPVPVHLPSVRRLTGQHIKHVKLPGFGIREHSWRHLYAWNRTASLPSPRVWQLCCNSIQEMYLTPETTTELRKGPCIATESG